MVLDQMAKDPTRMQGPRTVKEGIAYDTGEQITRCVPDIMTENYPIDAILVIGYGTR
jgi:hypothetical protein